MYKNIQEVGHLKDIMEEKKLIYASVSVNMTFVLEDDIDRQHKNYCYMEGNEVMVVQHDDYLSESKTPVHFDDQPDVSYEAYDFIFINEVPCIQKSNGNFMFEIPFCVTVKIYEDQKDQLMFDIEESKHHINKWYDIRVDNTKNTILMQLLKYHEVKTPIVINMLDNMTLDTLEYKNDEGKSVYDYIQLYITNPALQIKLRSIIDNRIRDLKEAGC